MTQLSPVSEKVWRDRYALRDTEGELLESGVDQMWRRVASAIAQAEWINNPKAAEGIVEFTEGTFYQLLQDFKFVPAGRILSGAGGGREVTYYNCFVIPSPEDSREGIIQTLSTMTEIMARGGGVGINFSTLRPSGSYIKSVNGTSSGPVNWMELFSVATGKVIQQGGTRRGALMAMLDDDHPDIEAFIAAKRIDPATNKPVAIEHANISICVSDEFMQAVKADGEWQTQFPTRANIARATLEELVRLPGVKYGPKYRARDLWEKICTAAWSTAEPGVVFMERGARQANTWYYENIRCVNPCGEQLLPEWGVCNLGHMNLSAYVRESGKYDPATDTITDLPWLDFGSLRRDVKTAMRFLDNVIDASPYFLEENERQQKGTRRTGLGTMGLADALIKLGIRYGSAESIEFIEVVYQLIRDAAYAASVDLAREKGAFPRFDRYAYLGGEFIARLPEHLRHDIREHGIRNAVLLSQAPTGTTSLVAGVSSGIEPVFSFATKRVDRTGESYLYHPLMQAWISANQDPDDGVVYADPPAYFVTTHDLTPEEHIRVQAAVQKYTDSSISKTVNGPHDHTVQDVMDLYMLAYDSGCKGVTYYRDGSRDAVLTAIKEEKTDGLADRGADHLAAAGAGVDRGDAPGRSGHAGLTGGDDEEAAALPRDPAGGAEGGAGRAGRGVDGAALPFVTGFRHRPTVLPGYTREIATPVGDAHVTINGDKDGPLEVFVTVGRSGGDVAAISEALGRLISATLRIPSTMSPLERVELLAEQLVGIGGRQSVGFGKHRVLSLPDGIGQVLAEHVANERDAADAMEEGPDFPALVAEALQEAVISSPGALKALTDDAIKETKNEVLIKTYFLSNGESCPGCGDLTLVRQEGCSHCDSCGYSAC